jgi:hypothetical protein
VSALPDFLLIGGGFFNYSKEIAATLERRGRRVIAFEDRPATDTTTKVLIRLAPSLVAARAEAYFDDIIRKVRGAPIRDVLVIKGESLSPAAITRLRRAFPGARFTLYFWDSYRNMPGDSSAKVALFDQAFTFDPLDAQADPRLTYRTLFFLDEYARLPPAPADVDVLFFGTVHTDRYAVLARLARVLPPGIRFERVLYVPSTAIYRARRVFDPAFWPARRAEFIFEPLAKQAIQALIARARIVVDIERAVQAGLTMRTVEMLGAGKKLITTNPMVQRADFFDPANIAVIDRERPVLPAGFLEAPYVAPPAALLERYSLSGWLREVVG